MQKKSILRPPSQNALLKSLLSTLPQVFSVVKPNDESMKKVNLCLALRKNRPRVIRSITFLMIVLVVTIPVIAATLICLQVLANLETAQKINDVKTKHDLRNKFDRTYNYTELFLWVHQNLNFTWEKIERHTDPVEILEYGKGRCGEFAILYAALCLAHGYECRFDVNIFGDHQWVEVKIDNEWLHFDPSLDPSDPRVNDRLMYERDWNAPLILVLAFENSSVKDVTNMYRTGFWINIFSAEMFSLLTIVSFIFLFIMTSGSSRRLFYGLYFKRKKGILNSIGRWYERSLRYLYVLRFISLFLLPTALAVAIRIDIQENLLNLIAIGFAMTTFSAIELPSLTKPNVFISVLPEDNKEITSITECEEIEMQVAAKTGVQRNVMFRIANLCLHTLKDCTFIFNFPKDFALVPYDNPTYEDLDFKKQFSIQKRNNACIFTPKDSYTTFSPVDCLIFPIVAKLEGNSQEKLEIGIEISSQSTWGSKIYHFPVKRV